MYKSLFNLLVYLYLVQTLIGVKIEHGSRRIGNSRDPKKLFGGYRITPRSCKPTRKLENSLGGPNVCMFNHECTQRNGQVVGACMDGFLFGACCQLPIEMVGELIDSDLHTVANFDNNLHYKPTTRNPEDTNHPTVSQITLNGISQISEALLKDEVLPTAQDDAVVQVGGLQDHFSTTGVTHPSGPDTFLLNQDGLTDINPAEFKKSSTPMPLIEDSRTTMKADSTTPYRPISPLIQISISNTPDIYSSPKPTSYERPGFRPKPSRPTTDDNFILVPTISHTVRPNRPQDLEPIANILIEASSTSSYASSGTYPYTKLTTRKPPSTSYVFSLTPSRRPGISTTVTKKPPSTSYVYSSTPLPLRPNSTKKPKPTKSSITKPTKSKLTSGSTLYLYPTTPISSNYIYNVSPISPSTTKRPLSTSYVYSTSISKRPTVTANTASPSYSVYSNPKPNYSSSPPPTIIILGPSSATPPSGQSPSLQNAPTKKRPVSQLTIDTHVYHTENPAPTVLITPKPTTSTSQPPRPTTDNIYTSAMEVETSVDDLINFPPVRNPNLNISAYEEEFTTPEFLEDEALKLKMESFVNKIVLSLQEPFHGLKDVIHNKNTTVFFESSSKRPSKKPIRSTTKPVSSKKPTTKKPSSTLSSRKPTTYSKRPTTPKLTTVQQAFETTESPGNLNSDYRQVCGVRPLIKTGRVVGGKPAGFGEHPWQVLVRESTWLGLFTKNKCGGVLISSRYVMTAAHCQPGFLASLVAVLGEHDISGEREAKRSLSRNVKRVIVHRQYDAATFENDLAILELEHPVQFDEHIVPICLPQEGEDFTGRMATVSGWGRLKYGGGVPSILQEVQVPIMENHVCQEMFKTAGHNKVILDSFLCAGYANGQKDSCEGDSGGPLVLQRSDGRYQLAGTVSHGIKCAAPFLPGVYMKTAFYKPWIESVTGVH